MKLKDRIKRIAFLVSSLSGAYISLSFSGLHRKKRMTEILGWNYAHRGLHDKTAGIPENSMSAFRAAIDHSYGIELDVRLTADKKLVVFHDETLLRICGLKKRVINMTYDEIKKLPLLGTEERAPLFSDVLELVDGRVPLLIELKAEQLKRTQLCYLVWQELKKYKGTYCIQSFNPFVLQWFRIFQPQVARGQLSCDFYKESPHLDPVLFLSTHLMYNFLSYPDFISYKYMDTSIPAYQLNKRIFRCLTALWTIRSRKTYEEYRNKADIIIFENFRP